MGDEDDDDAQSFHEVTPACYETRRSLYNGLLNILAFLILLSGLYLCSRWHCAFVWIIMVSAFLLMTFCGMHFLWIVVAASFVVSFYVGCQMGTRWVTVTSKFSLP